MTAEMDLSRAGLARWLREEDPDRLEVLFASADATRARHVGDEVHRRGLIEISNHCVRRCAYCGIRSSNTEVARYRMEPEEILACARQAKSFGYGTVVLQSGEDRAHTTEWVAELVRRIAGETGLAITLSLGERPLEDYEAWRRAGADRYLLRFETTDPELFARIHPGYPGREPRLAILRRLRELDYEVGSGVMIGIPGQSYDSLARDLELFRELDLDMIGVGPYIPHPDTPLELGLQRGANIVMPNLTPPTYRVLYEIYPGKACVSETAAQCALCLDGRIHTIGRVPGTGPGWRPGHEPAPRSH